jgi:integrase
MATARHLLNPTRIEALKEPGRYADGAGLFLFVRPTGTKNWIVRVQKDGRRRDIGLGGYPKLSLAKARQRAGEVQSQIEEGLDPVLERKKAAGCPTFEKAAQTRHAELAPGFRNAKHAAQWLSSLEAYAFPSLARLTVDKVTAAHVRDALLPIWLEKPETARRVHQRIVDVLVWAVAKQYRPDVPLLSSKALRLPRQVDAVVHHAAMAFDDVPAFLSVLRAREGLSRLALEALILTAARSGEVRGATWNEVDLERRLWTIPADRMKAGREHVVPLSASAAAAFERAKAYKRAGTNLVFPGLVRGKPLSDMALTKLLRDLGAGVTAHGFRSSFRDWCSERTSFPSEVAEMALAHTIASKVEAAYRRGNLLEKRRELMEAWGRFCESTNAMVIALADRRSA